MTLRELKYVIYGDDRMSGSLSKIAGSSSAAENSIGKATKKVNDLNVAQTKVVSSSGLMTTGVSKAAASITAMINPVTVVTGVVTGMGIAFNKGLNEVAKFQLEFRKLQNINLDKSNAEITRLRNNLLSISSLKGYDANASSMAYFDVQSLAGTYGFETEQVIKKQGDFALAYGADFNKYIASTGVAMKNYGFGSNQLDEFNKASMGLVATAKITYDKLAEVMPVYAGSASAANQTFQSANKLMAIMTTKSKSPDEAATLTKSAFTDLFKASTVKSFKSVGIDLYDMAGNAKQVDKIMLELNAKFQDTNSAKQMDELRNKFSGSEGINMLLSAASDKTGALAKSFEAFDAAGAGMNQGLKTMQNDINVINDQINNKLRSSWISLGDQILPAWINIKKVILEAVDGLHGVFQFGNMAAGLMYSRERKANAGWLDKVYSTESGVVGKAGDMSYEQFNKTKQYYKQQYDAAYRTLQNPESPAQVEDAMKRMEMYQQLMLDLTAGYGAKGKTVAASVLPTENPTQDPTGNHTIKNMLSGVSGGGTRNITVSIEKMIEEFNVNTTNLRESPEQVKTLIEETLVRAVAGAEQTLSN